MPLDDQAKRLLAMMAAASPADRVRPSADQRRQALRKLMQFTRADVAAATRALLSRDDVSRATGTR